MQFQLRTQGFTPLPKPLHQPTPVSQTPQQIYSMQNPWNSSHPIYYLKIFCYKRKKNTMQYKRLTVSSSLLHNFQPIRKTNKSPTTGGRGLGLFEGWVFFLLPSGNKTKNYVTEYKRKWGEKNSPGKWLFWYSIVFFSLNCYLLPFPCHWAYSQGMCPSKVSFLSTFPLAFSALEGRLLLTQMVNGHETPKGRGK